MLGGYFMVSLECIEISTWFLSKYGLGFNYMGHLIN